MNRGRRHNLMLVLAGATLAGCGGTSTAALRSPAQPGATAAVLARQSAAFPDTDWTTYHATGTRTGAVAAGTTSGAIRKVWSTNLGGAVYGQPLVAGGKVFAATERNNVVALNAVSGKVLWSHSIGPAQTSVDSIAGCGDIDPLGITSTPVLDAKAEVIYVVGEVRTSGGRVHHQLEGLNAATGKLVISRDVDPPLPAGESAVHLLQRSGLALANGRVYVAYGGNDGDCGSYHGWVVSVEETGAARTQSFEVAADGEGGAIWESGGAPAVDSDGDLYVTTGNANPDPPQGGPDPKAYTESVVRLSPALKPLAAFKDKVAGGDEDLATGNPVLLPGGGVFSVGKTDIGYVLDAKTLRQRAAISGVCGSDPDGGPAYDASTNTVFIPCKGGGIQEVNLTTRRLGPRLSDANGSPILIGKDIWAAQYPDGTVTEFSATTGKQLAQLSVGGPIPSFVSPSTGSGLLLIGTRAGVTAFR